MFASTRSLDKPVEPDAPESPAPRTGLSAFVSRFAWFVLFYNLFVIIVGTVVRATRSGDGCGAHWPLCDGEYIPTAPSIARVIEYTHRLVSGLDGLFVLALVGLGFAVFWRQKNHPVKGALIASLLFTGLEGFIGAVLVKKGYVADNPTVARAIWMVLHLVNTFFLLTALTLAAWWASGKETIKLRGQGAIGAGLFLVFVFMLALGASGAITALGDTLFPVRDHADAMAQSLSPTAHFLQKLRTLHPYIAGSVGLYIILISGLTAHLRPSAHTQRYAMFLTGLFVTQMAVGGVNVYLKAPVWMQIIHLLLGDLVWIGAVLLTVSAFAVSVPHVEKAVISGQWAVDGEDRASDAPPPQSAPVTVHRSLSTRLRDYVILTKPKVNSLLLVTAIMPMFMAAGGFPGWQSLLAVLIGGYLSAGAAGAINMVVDRDIDGLMKRTANRPIITERVSSRDALFFGLTLAVLSFAVLFAFANLLTALLSLAGLVFYVNIYTLLLKRRTWHNIVIGGAAGAFPPLVGWAAVTDTLSPLAWWLFAIIFVWTPAHFWALAILMKDDYARAKIPMLPVVSGVPATVLQIALYSILTAIVSILPLAQGLVGPWYVGVAVILNIALIFRACTLFTSTERSETLGMYLFSMLYLALLFLMLAFDRADAGMTGAMVTSGLVLLTLWYGAKRAKKTAAQTAPVTP
ncbi:MAG: protoheme IX farnesyltransferase [Fibrella sp.]|nr:protoheme IX farnesyltransferase [Armatimonadota bacterium]